MQGQTFQLQYISELSCKLAILLVLTVSSDVMIHRRNCVIFSPVLTLQFQVSNCENLCKT